jgi:undecaprenyl diphosphate synthase
MTLPRHIAVIMDGNGRWAEARGYPRSTGHQSGLEPVRMCIRRCRHLGIAALTIYAFSSENWHRPPAEVEALMNLFFDALAAETDALLQNGVRMTFIGDRSALSAELRARMVEAEQRTAGNHALHFQVAVSYGGRNDIVRAARALAEDCLQGTLEPVDIDEARVAEHISLAGLPEPDLFIRTGGEQRISNFLLWNLAYTELYFTDTLWPDFDEASLERALEHFATRQRRYGLTGAQIAASSAEGP